MEPLLRHRALATLVDVETVRGPRRCSVAGVGDKVVWDTVAPGVAQQPLDGSLDLRIAALSEAMVPDSSFRVRDVRGRPVLIVESAPDPVFAVERDRIADCHLLRRVAHVLATAFGRAHGRVYTDDDRYILDVAQ